MANENRTYDLKVEKMISKTPAEVFRALSEGRLFMNCGADHESMKIDFRVGGKYSIEFVAYGMRNQGEFLEIVPNRKIAFTWCQDYNSNATPDTKVLIELKDLDGKTALTLTHTGFSDLEGKKAHEQGWNSGLGDLGQEMTTGKLRFVRKFPMSVEKLYEICKNPKLFSGSTGEILEAVPNQKIIFSGKSGSKITMLFEAGDEPRESWLELLHEGLETEALQFAERGKWDSLLKKLK